MPLVKYRIYELSARAVISYGREQDGAHTPSVSAPLRQRDANHVPHPTSRTITRCSIRSCACCTATPSPEHPAGSW